MSKGQSKSDIDRGSEAVEKGIYRAANGAAVWFLIFVGCVVVAAAAIHIMFETGVL